MQSTPISNRLHVGIFGRRNAGKSLLLNAVSGQDHAIVSDVPGTTTDPVCKTMEIHGLGPVAVIDTGGLDDEGAVGKMRVKKTYGVLNKTDIAVLVVDKQRGWSECEENFAKEVNSRKIPLLVVLNKIDISKEDLKTVQDLKNRGIDFIKASALRKLGIDLIIQKISESCPEDFERKEILSDLISEGDLVVIVAPMDMEAPKGRLKLPQVQTIRDILDKRAMTLVVKETDLEDALGKMTVKPVLVITESQVFGKVSAIVPKDIQLTSFSVLYARYKGDMDSFVEGVNALENLKPGLKVLIAEACTHHPVGDDIGTVILPDLLNKKTRGLIIEHSRGHDFKSDLSKYDLIIHCGACMLNRREMLWRINQAKEQGVPVTNYGMALAYFADALDRALEPFASVCKV